MKIDLIDSINGYYGTLYFNTYRYEPTFDPFIYGEHCGFYDENNQRIAGISGKITGYDNNLKIIGVR